MKSWEQQEGESDTAFAHFLAFLSLGVERSIIRGLSQNRSENGRGGGQLRGSCWNNAEEPPTA